MVTAIIPAYNCEDSITEVVNRTAHFVDQIIVVNDGSTDNTGRKLSKISQRHAQSSATAATATVSESVGQKVVVVHLEKNMGKSHALREGLKHVTDFPIIILDADLQHNPEEIPRLMRPIQEGRHDVVLGSRFIGNHSRMPLPNRFSNRLVSGISSRLLGERISDIQSGFRAFNKTATKTINWSGERFDIDISTIVDASIGGLSIGEVPIPAVYGKERSNIKITREVVRVTRLMLDVFAKKRSRRRNKKRKI